MISASLYFIFSNIPQDFQRVYIQHHGADGVDIDSVHVYIYQPSTNINQCIQCKRKDNNAIFVGLMDNNDYVDLVCDQNCWICDVRIGHNRAKRRNRFTLQAFDF